MYSVMRLTIARTGVSGNDLSFLGRPGRWWGLHRQHLVQRFPPSHLVHTGFLCFSANDGLTFCTKSKWINETLFAMISIGKQTKHESTIKLVE